jgi:acetyltransferase
MSTNRTDPSQNFIERYPQALDALFRPMTVAVIGAKDTPGSVGFTLMTNLTNALYSGKVYPVNPKRTHVLGLISYSSIKEVPEPIDLAIIITPAETVPKIIQECVEAHVKSAIIISAGFKELGVNGLKLEKEILFHARRGSMPIIGPNCLGVMNPIFGLNATFASGMALPGHLAFISQSGAMCTAVLDWSRKQKVGFSAFVSIGSMADVNWGHLIDYLGSDPNTHSLLLYMETIGDARAFMTAAREVALEKPIIVIKAGRSEVAAKAAASHTGSLAGSDEVFDAALERIGVLRVDSIADLFSMASVLSRQPLPKGPNLTILTNAGGPAVLATDAAVSNQAMLTSLSKKTLLALDDLLPPAWSHSNPVDILGDASAERYRQSLEILIDDPNTDGILTILSPQDMTDPTATAEQLNISSSKVILASWMGGEAVHKGIRLLTEAKIPNFDFPDDAARTFAMMWRYSKNLKALYETPVINRLEGANSDRFLTKYNVEKVIDQAGKQKREILTEFESKQILDYYRIPVVKTLVAKDRKDAVEMAKEIGFPVVIKLFSEKITHKTDVGGVKLNLKNDDEVIAAYDEIEASIKEKVGSDYFQGVTVQKMIKHDGYELILGSSTDPQFGPVLLFGIGGQLVEVLKDRSLAIPPLNRNLARQLMQKTKIYQALLGVRGRKPVDLSKLEDILINFSQMIVENKRIKECDINPLIVSDKEILALDARFVLHPSDMPDDELPQLAIRPYPLEYSLDVKIKNGEQMTLRLIRPEDEPLISNFHKELSENSVRQRYFEFMSLDDRVAHERLIRICFNDYDREWAIVAEIRGRIIGIGRLYRIPNTGQAQFKMTIIDNYHHLGIGTKILQHLLTIAKKEKIEQVHASILIENEGMIKICKKNNFEILPSSDPLIVHALWKNNEL